MILKTIWRKKINNLIIIVGVLFFAIVGLMQVFIENPANGIFLVSFFLLGGIFTFALFTKNETFIKLTFFILLLGVGSIKIYEEYIIPNQIETAYKDNNINKLKDIYNFAPQAQYDGKTAEFYIKILKNRAIRKKILRAISHDNLNALIDLYNKYHRDDIKKDIIKIEKKLRKNFKIALANNNFIDAMDIINKGLRKVKNISTIDILHTHIDSIYTKLHQYDKNLEYKKYVTLIKKIHFLKQKKDALILNSKKIYAKLVKKFIRQYKINYGINAYKLFKKGLKASNIAKKYPKIYAKYIKIQSLAKKNKLKLYSSNNSRLIYVSKFDTKIATIFLGNTIKAKCIYLKLNKNFEEIFSAIKHTKTCKINGYQCSKNNECLAIKNTKIIGYIRSTQPDAKKDRYVWNVYNNKNILIDEYTTVKEGYRLLTVLSKK